MPRIVLQWKPTAQMPSGIFAVGMKCLENMKKFGIDGELKANISFTLQRESSKYVCLIHFVILAQQSHKICGFQQ